MSERIPAQTLLPQLETALHRLVESFWEEPYRFLTEADAVAGLHAAIAKRVMSMVKRLGVVPPLAMAGGVAKNAGVVRAIEDELGEALVIPPEPQIVGALGAAIVAMEDQQSQSH